MDITRFLHLRFDYSGSILDEDTCFKNAGFWSVEKIPDISGRNPFTAYASMGNGAFNLTVGRDRVSAGTGNTGNLGLDHNTRFADYIKASAVCYPVAFDTTVLTYSGQNKIDGINFDGPTTFVAFHRFSITPFNWLTLTAYEGCLQYGNVSAFDSRFLNPLNIFHNTYAFEYGNQNNFFGVDFNFSVFRNSEITAQVFVDQLQMPNEVEDEFGNLPPNAFGILAAWNVSREVNKGFLNAYAEAVYTSPALYLKEDYPEGTDVRYYCVDLYVYTNNDSGFVGHEFGPDTVAFSTGASYLKDNYEISSSLTFKASGSFGYSEGQIDHTGWTEDYFYLKSPSSFDGRVPTYSLSAEISGSYRPLDYLELNGVLSFEHEWNHNHVENSSWSECQLYIGVKVDIVAPISDRL